MFKRHRISFLIIAAFTVALVVNAQRGPKFRGLSKLRLGSPVNLLFGVVSHWRMDEAVGNDRADSAGTNILDEVGTISNDTGKITNSAVGSSGSLLSCEALPFRITTFTYSGWVWFDSTSEGQTFLARYNTSSDDFLRFAAGDGPPGVGPVIDFRVSTNGSSLTSKVRSLWPLTNGLWYFVVAGCDSTDKTMWIRVNTEAVQREPLPVDITIVQDGGTNLRFLYGTVFGNFSGRVDSWTFWRRHLNTYEIDALWNGGAGLDWPFQIPP